MSEHTPIPWRICPDEDNPEQTLIVTAESDPWVIAEMARGCDHYEKYSDIAQPEDDANAHFIVLACNLHDEMRRVLKELASFSFSFDPRDQANGAYRDAVRQLQRTARAVLAKAEKGVTDEDQNSTQK
jgi:hypothetical protein